MDSESIFQRQKAYFAAGETFSLESRHAALKRLSEGLDRHERALSEALREDLGKSAVEGLTSELLMVRLEISHARRHLKRWMASRWTWPPVLAIPGKARVIRVACGSVLIIGPWNYPVQLMLGPAVGAIAAGCTVVLKPSEFARKTSEALVKLIEDCFPPEHVFVVPGARETAVRLQQLPFDHVFFTGSGKAGREVLKAAAETLTPVTLELGGKCPAMVFPGNRGPSEFRRSLDTIARRIAWGKYLNAGQTCIAPDHVYVAKEFEAPLIDALSRAYDSFGKKEHGRIIHREHFERVKGYMAEGEIAYGGESDEDALSIAPTILTNVSEHSPVMKEEIFGPVLPVISCIDLSEAIERVRNRPAPLAIYLFSKDRRLLRKVARQTTSGALCFNDTVVQATTPSLPFGGVGASGMGRWHGEASFNTFTRERVVVEKSLFIDPGVRYPPWTGKLKAVERFMRMIK